MKTKHIFYQPQGVCSQMIDVTADENDVIQQVMFLGGCNGNLQGVSRLVEGMKAEVRLQIEGGMTMQECCAALEERQKREQKIRLKAAESVKMAQENYRAEMLERVNRRLKSMGMAELGDNDILKK